MPLSLGDDLIDGDAFTIEEFSDGSFEFRHDSTGNRLKYNASEGKFDFNSPLDFDGGGSGALSDVDNLGFADNDGDGDTWGVQEESSNGRLEFEHAGALQIAFDQSGGLRSDSHRITDQDLSQLSSSEKKDKYIYRHNGTASITLADSTTTSNKGYYWWDNANSGWVQLATDADTVDGKHADDLVATAGDTMTGSLRIDTDTSGDALFELLTASGASVYPTLHMGSDADNGVRFIQRPDTSEELTIEHVSGGTETPMARVDEGGWRDMEFLAPDGFENFMQLEREGSIIAQLDNNASNIRWEMHNSENYVIEDNGNENQIRFSPAEPKIEVGASFEQGLIIENDTATEEGFIRMDDTSTGETDVAKFSQDGTTSLEGNTLANHRRDRLPIVTSDTTLSDEAVTQPVDTTGGPVTITLASSLVANGVWTTVSDEGVDAQNNAITITTEGTAEINGSTSAPIDAAYGTAILYSDGTDWYSAATAAGVAL